MPSKWRIAGWATMIRTSLNFIADAIFYKEDHRFYVVGYTSVNVRVVAVDILQEQEMEMPELEEAIETEMASDRDLAIRLHIAVGGPSGLVVVLRLLKFLKIEKIPYDLTVGFKLFKLDETETKWVVTKSLDDDGHGMVFLGSNNSVWLSSGDFKGLCKGNSIYFTDDDRFNSVYYAGLGGESGVFHLEDGSFRSIYDNDLKYLYPHPVWVLPNP
ncbi:F-box protein [Acorus calamus]|uniref:F-box protein n=1 Tax=Acorus calamus TaxID=4465 RepID=A0AAV9CR97_ACOCL|nr:F-box protein [Acorus calamus]